MKSVLKEKYKMVHLLLDSLSNVGDFLQNVLDCQNYFLHHMYLIHQPLFSSFLKRNKRCADTDEVLCMSIVGQDRQRPVYHCCAITCDLSIEWPIMSKHCTSSDYAFEDETDSVLKSCYVDGWEISAFVRQTQWSCCTSAAQSRLSGRWKVHKMAWCNQADEMT